MKPKPIVINRKLAGDNHAVVTVEGGSGRYCKTPCSGCPWSKSNVGSFPADAFRHSAPTAYDAALTTFRCHMTGIDKPATCAGFLLSEGADDNLGVRIGQIRGKFDVFSTDGDDLFATYRQMAESNGVSPDDPVLDPCVPESRKDWDRFVKRSNSK